MGALYIDGGMEVTRKFLCNVMFYDKNESHLRDIWLNLPSHVLEEEEPYFRGEEYVLNVREQTFFHMLLKNFCFK